MPNSERTLVFALRQFANNVTIEFLSRRSQFLVDFGEFVPDVDSLTGRCGGWEA